MENQKLETQQELHALRYQYVGSHFPKEKTLEGTVRSFYKIVKNKNIPFQFFLRSPMGNNTVKYTEKDISQTRSLIKENGYKVFVHAPYYINLSNPVGGVLGVLKEDLDTASKMGCRGVVIHVGKYSKMITEYPKAPTRKKATEAAKKVIAEMNSSGTKSPKFIEKLVKDLCKLKVKEDKELKTEEIRKEIEQLVNGFQEKGNTKMKESILNVLEAATEDCPLLLETPAGQGSELLQTPEEFSEFYSTFEEETKKKFGVCVDTCHIFACGYMPLDYIKIIESRCKIQLIHLNNSSDERGSKKDRHSYILNQGGKIPDQEIINVILYCISREYPQVTE